VFVAYVLYSVPGCCLEDGTPSQARKRLFASDMPVTTGVYSPGNVVYTPGNSQSVLLDGSAGGTLLQDRNGVCNGNGAMVMNNVPAHAAKAPRNAHERTVLSPANAIEDMYGLSKQQLCENQMVKSLLRAMLAKSKSDGSETVEALVKHERHIDCGSENVSETAACAVQTKDEEDDRSATGSLIRDDPMSIESETESTTLQNGSFAQNESSDGTPGTPCSTEKSSLCPYCLKIFRYRSSYRRHVKIHEGIFSHECMVCQRKFTRKEHFVRHKCDRRANKPYHLSHFVFHRERKTSTKSSIGRNGFDNGVEKEADNYNERPEPNGHVSDVPLELTSQSMGKLDSTTIGSSGEHSGHSSSGSPARVVSNNRVSFPSVGDHGQHEVISDGTVLDCSLFNPNEKRRKSSTPRKVVSLMPEKIAGLDRCDIDYYLKRDKFEGLTFDIAHPVH